MRTFVGHKVVQAEKIENMRQSLDTLTFIFASEDGNERESITMTFLELQNRPKGIAVGWYCIKYPDGYISFSPPDAFEDGYTEDKKLVYWTIRTQDEKHWDVAKIDPATGWSLIVEDLDYDTATMLCNEHNKAIGYKYQLGALTTEPEATSQEQ